MNHLINGKLLDCAMKAPSKFVDNSGNIFSSGTLMFNSFFNGFRHHPLDKNLEKILKSSKKKLKDISQS